jgi:anti-sigma B factor antagonist
MVFDRSMINDVCVLTPKKNLTGGDETRALTDAVEAVTAEGVSKLIIDLGKINWVNSMGLAGLQRARLACVNRGAAFALANVGGRIKNLMLTTRLVILFDTFETLDEALAAQESTNA